MITLMRKPLDRRTVLRGLGAALALPLMEAMLPTRAPRSLRLARNACRSSTRPTE